MDINTALRAIESKQSSEAAHRQIESGGTSAEEFAALFRRVSEAPAREIEKLVIQLQRLRTQLENAGNRIQRDIAQYTELSQQTTQLTAIISDSVQKLPNGAELPQYNTPDMVAAIRDGVTEQLERERSGRNFGGTARRH